MALCEGNASITSPPVDSPHKGPAVRNVFPCHDVMKVYSISPVACFAKEVNPWLAKRPLVFNGRLANHGLTSLVKQATGGCLPHTDKMATISQTIFSSAFPWMKTFQFQINFTEICSLGSNRQYGSIGSDNGLAPNRRQVIIWTKDGMFYWYTFTSFGLNELMVYLPILFRVASLAPGQ